MQYMVWRDILKAQSWCISPIMVVRLRKDYIYIWVYKQCNRYETYDTFFFFFLFLLIMILKFVNIWFIKKY